MDRTMDFLTVRDVGHMLEVSDDTVRKYHRQGKIPARLTRRGIRLFTREDIEAFQAKRLAAAQAAAKDKG